MNNVNTLKAVTPSPKQDSKLTGHTNRLLNQLSEYRSLNDEFRGILQELGGFNEDYALIDSEKVEEDCTLGKVNRLLVELSDEVSKNKQLVEALKEMV